MTASDIDHIINHLSLKKRLRRWRWIAFGLGVALLIGFLSRLGGGGISEDHVARLWITGLITGEQRQLDLIRTLRDDKKVQALLIRIDSPGGTTVGSEALYEELLDFAAKKPVVAVMDSVAASGGYIAALPAEQIFARGNTITGSIGVIFAYPEISGLLNTLGVKFEEIKSGELKAEPSGTKPTSERVKAVTMEMVQDGFTWFKRLVAERRKLSPPRVDVLADGRVYSGRQAVKEGLIDAIGGEDEALAWLNREKAISIDMPIYTREPKKELREEFFGARLGRSLITALGLDRFAAKSEAAQLDGLLVLWQPHL